MELGSVLVNNFRPPSLQNCPKLVIGLQSYPVLLKQYRGVTIKKFWAAKQTATGSALLCGGVSGSLKRGGGGRKSLNRKLPILDQSGQKGNLGA